MKSKASDRSVSEDNGKILHDGTKKNLPRAMWMANLDLVLWLFLKHSDQASHCSSCDRENINFEWKKEFKQDQVQHRKSPQCQGAFSVKQCWCCHLSWHERRDSVELLCSDGWLLHVVWLGLSDHGKATPTSSRHRRCTLLSSHTASAWTRQQFPEHPRSSR